MLSPVTPSITWSKYDHFARRRIPNSSIGLRSRTKKVFLQTSSVSSLLVSNSKTDVLSVTTTSRKSQRFISSLDSEVAVSEPRRLSLLSLPWRDHSSAIRWFAENATLDSLLKPPTAGSASVDTTETSVPRRRWRHETPGVISALG